jgi:hypothetical protein
MAARTDGAVVRDLGRAVARRALDVARDPGISVDEGSRHLHRLAKGQDALLRSALGQLVRVDTPGANADHARHLLRAAIALADEERDRERPFAEAV